MAMNEAALRLVISAQNLTQEAFASLTESLQSIADSLTLVAGVAPDADGNLAAISEQAGPMEVLRAAVTSVSESLTPVAANAQAAVEPLTAMGDAAVPGLEATNAALDQVAAKMQTVKEESVTAGGSIAAGTTGGAAAGGAGSAAAGGWAAGADKLSGLGMTLATIGAGIGAIGGISVYSAAKFQQAMELIHTNAGATQAEVDKMSKAIMGMGGSVAQGPMQLAQALFYIESAGYRGAKALDMLKTAAEGAAVGHADLNSVALALVSTVASGIKGAQDLGQAMGAVIGTTGSGTMTMQDFTDALKSGIVPVARAAGLSIRDVGAAIATLTDLGVPADEATTRLRMTLMLMAAPTKQATKELEGIGMTQLQLAQDMRSGGLLQALEDLRSHLSALGPNQQGEVLARAFGGGKSSSTIITLLENLDRLRSKYKDVGAASLDFGKDVAASAKTAAVQWGETWGSLQTSFIELGNALAPAALAIANAIKGVAEAFSHLSPGTIQAIADAIMVLTPLLLGLGAALMTLGAVARAAEGFEVLSTVLDGVALGPVALIAAALVALGVVIYEAMTHWKDITGWMQSNVPGVWNAVGTIITTVGQIIHSVVQDISSVIQAVWASIDNWTHQHWGEIQTVIKVVTDVVKALVTAWVTVLAGEIRGAWQGIAQTLGGIWDIIKGVFMTALNIIEGVIGVFLDLVTGHWQKAFTDLRDTVANVMNDIGTVIEGVVSAIEGPINAFVGMVGGAISAVKQLLGLQSQATSQSNAQIGGGINKAASLDKIPRLATGGLVHSPTLALVGESGPEAVLPLSQFPINGGAIGSLGSGMGAAPIINVYVTGNVTKNENELADRIAERLQQRVKWRAQMEF